MRVKVRMTRGRKKHPNWSGILEDVRKTMGVQGSVARLGRSYFNRIAAPWKNKPKNVARVRNTSEEFITWVGPSEARIKAKRIWAWVSFGTGLYGPKRSKYPIKPKRAKTLHFRTGYQPRTSPGGSGRYGGPGKATGDYVRTKEVEHPGIKARLFEKAIARWSRPKFSREIRNAIRRGARRA